MKKLVAAILALALIISLAACTEKGKNAAPEKSSAPPSETATAANDNTKTLAELFPDEGFAMIMSLHFDASVDYVPTYNELSDVKTLKLHYDTIVRDPAPGDSYGDPDAKIPCFEMYDATGIEYLTGLMELDVDSLDISGTIDLSNASELEILRWIDTDISGVILPTDAPLKVVDIEWNKLKNVLAVKNLEAAGDDTIFTFYPQEKGYGEYVENPNRKQGDKSIAEIFPDPVLAGEIARYFGGVTGYRPTPGEFLRIEMLSLRDKSIKSLEGIEYLAALNWLDASETELSGVLDLRGNKNLKRVFCDYTELTGIALSGNPMEALGAGGTWMTSLDDVTGYVPDTDSEYYSEPDFEPLPVAVNNPTYTYDLNSYSTSSYTPSYSSRYTSTYSGYSSGSSYSYTPDYYVNHYTGDLYTSKSYTWRTNPYTGSGSYYDDSWDW